MKTILLSCLLFISATLCCQTFGDGVTDIDGNNYTSVIIGAQEWLVENLKTTHYANGDPISNITTPLDWKNTTNGAWSFYDNDYTYDTTYGKLYNWYAIADSRSICPDGWRVPSHSDWQTLQNFLGGGYYQGGKLKEFEASLWTPPNTGATNEYGFTALPGGSREKTAANNFVFKDLSNYGYYWSTWDNHPTERKKWKLSYSQNILMPTSAEMNDGYSCRCLKSSALSLDNVADTPSITKAYPNPTKGSLTIIISNHQIGKNFRVTDILGRTVLSGKFSELENNISLASFNPGIYVLTYNKSSKKIVKE